MFFIFVKTLVVMTFFAVGCHTSPHIEWGKSIGKTLSSVEQCRVELRSIIRDELSWRITTLPSYKISYLNDLFYRSSNNENITYRDQKQIHKYFGVWVSKRNVVESLYLIYPSYLKKHPEYREELLVVEVLGSMYRLCQPKALEEGYQNATSRVAYIEDKILAIPKEEKEKLSDALASALPWYDLTGSWVVEAAFDEFTAMLAESKEDVFGAYTFVDRQLFHYFIPRLYQLNLYELFKAKEYSKAVSLGASVAFFASDVPSNRAFDAKVRVTKKLYCRLINQGEDEDYALLAAGVVWKSLKNHPLFCDYKSTNTSFCASSLVSQLAQVSKETRNFSYDIKSLTFDLSHASGLFNEDIKRKDRKELALYMLGKDSNNFKALYCK